MSSNYHRSLLVGGLKQWLRGMSRGAPARRRSVRPQVEVLERRDAPSVSPFLVKDIAGGDRGSGPASTTNVSGTLFFAATDYSHGSELWKSNGNSLGTHLVKDIISGPGGSSPSNLANVNGTLFFAAGDGHGTELWKSTGKIGRAHV